MQGEDVIFQPLAFPHMKPVKNRVFRSSLSGRFDNYNGRERLLESTGR